MQAGKNAMETMKEKAANVGASAKSGKDKTKAVVEEKVQKVTAQHPAEKQMAEHKKQAKIHEAELAKRETMEYNAAVREHACNGPVKEGVAHTGPTGLTTGTARPSAAHQPAAETGYPGPAEEGVAHTGPTGLTTSTARPSTAHQPPVETGYPGPAEEGVAHTGPAGLTIDTDRSGAAHQLTAETGYPAGPGIGPNSA